MISAINVCDSFLCRLPLTFKDWRDKDLKLYKERVWLEVKVKFIIVLINHF